LYTFQDLNMMTLIEQVFWLSIFVHKNLIFRCCMVVEVVEIFVIVR